MNLIEVFYNFILDIKKGEEEEIAESLIEENKFEIENEYQEKLIEMEKKSIYFLILEENYSLQSIIFRYSKYKDYSYKNIKKNLLLVKW